MARQSGLTVTGAKEMRDKLTELGKKAVPVFMEAMKEFADVEMAEMKRRVPVDTGALKDSGTVDPPRIEGRNIKVGMHFDEPYALVVHEDLEAFHAVGEAKYMESVLNESKRYFEDRVIATVKRKLGL
jgi:hypothetical protein